MLLSSIKSTFLSRLQSLYPQLEIDSIFDLTIARLLNYSKIQIHQNLDKDISTETSQQILKIIDRLSTGEPVQYVLGKIEFFGLELRIDKRALIPRPETELLVQMAAKTFPTENNLRILDIGTGSGCIAVSMAKSYPNACITAMDISKKAIELARKNAEFHSLPIQFILDDILNPRAEYGLYNIIISNPPYVRNSEKQIMHKNILEFEPPEALFVDDNNPFLFYNAIASFARDHLQSEGKLFLEINEYLGKETKQIFIEKGYTDVEIHRDLINKNRFLTAYK